MEHLVTITGIGFDPDPAKNTITFNGTKAFTKNATLTSLVTKVPLGVLSGPVSVTVNNTASDNTMHFYVIPQSLSPCNDLISNTTSGSKKTGGSDVRPDGAFAYVTKPNENVVSVVDLLSANPGVVESIPVGTTPVNIDINPAGTTAYVTNFNSHDVSVIDLSTNDETDRISVGIQPYGIVATPDGKRVYVANSYSESLSLIDVDPNSGGFDHVVSNIPAGAKPKNSTATSDGAMVLVTSDNGLLIIDSNPEDANYNSVIANAGAGTKTDNAKVSSDAGLAFVTTEDGRLLIINLHPENGDYSDAVITNIDAGSKGGKLAVSGDGLFVYVTDPDNDQVLVYKISYGGGGSASNSSSVTGITLTLHSTIKVGDAPDYIIISDDATKLYVIDGASNGDREIKTLKLCCGPVAPVKSIGDLIITVQNMINNGNIPKLRGYALIITLNAALRNVNASRPKLAILDLNAFIALVKTYIKNKQVTVPIGNALINSANAIISQLKGTKSDEEENYATDLGIQSDNDIITGTRLGIIYPNPTKEGITINYEVAADELNGDMVSIQVYDISGRIIGNLVNRNHEPGCYSVSWNGHYENGGPVPRGIYYIRFTTGNVKEVKQIMLVR